MSENTNELNKISEDEIDIKELFITIFKYKYKILFFVSFVILITFVYLLSIPNLYKSEILLSPQNSQNNVSGSLSSLASLAGVNVAGANSKDPSVMMNTVLKDYNFNIGIIKKYNLQKKLNYKKNLVFAFGIDDIYNLLNKNDKLNDLTKSENEIFSTVKSLNKILSISSDKKTNIISLKAELADRYLAKKLVDIYLIEIINKIKKQDMKEIDKQISYYKKELSITYNVSLKEELSKSLSSLMQKKVFSQANDYYFVSKIVDSRVAHINEKIKPNRFSTLLISFLGSFFLIVFFIIFIEYFKNVKKD